MQKFNQKQATEFAQMAVQFYRRSQDWRMNEEQRQHYREMADYYWEMADR